MKVLEVPFYENSGDGKQCMQVSMKSILKHFLNKDFSLDELDILTNRKNGFRTRTSQSATVLYDLGLQVTYYSKEAVEPFLQGEPFIREYFGEDADKILEFTDLPVVMESISKLLQYTIFEKRELLFEEIQSHLLKGHVPLLLIDYNTLYDEDDYYQGHFVVVTGFDDECVFYHESGPENPEAHKKVPKNKFIDAWNANGTDNDVVIVYGRR